MVIANGASELISAITSLFVEHLAVPVPTFDEFLNRARSQGKPVSLFQLDGDFELDVEGFIQHVNDTQPNAALFIRLNNPTGTLISKPSLWHPGIFRTVAYMPGISTSEIIRRIVEKRV